MTTLRSVESVADVIADVIAGASAGRSRTIAGITGPPGAGKSTIAARVVNRLGSTAVLLGLDGFHLPQSRLVALGRRERMGAPDTFDVDGFVALLSRLHNAGAVVLAPGFDREIEEPVPDALALSPAIRAIVAEGNYFLHGSGGWERVAPLLDATFFVRVDHDIRLARLIERHVRFGKSLADARAWATGPDERNARLIEATAGRADHTIELD